MRRMHVPKWCLRLTKTDLGRLLMEERVHRELVVKTGEEERASFRRRAAVSRSVASDLEDAKQATIYELKQGALAMEAHHLRQITWEQAEALKSIREAEGIAKSKINLADNARAKALERMEQAERRCVELLRAIQVSRQADRVLMDVISRQTTVHHARKVKEAEEGA